MTNNLRNKLIGGLVVLAALVGVATPAFATDPVPPDVSTTVGTILAAFMNGAVTVLTSLASNEWILFAFGFGIGIAILAGVLRRFKGHSKRAVNH